MINVHTLLMAGALIAGISGEDGESPPYVRPSMSWGPEERIGSSDGAVYGELIISDVKISADRVMTCDRRIEVQSAVWGPVSKGTLQLGKHSFALLGPYGVGGGSGPGFDPWSIVGVSINEGRRTYPVFATYETSEGVLKPLFIRVEDSANALPSHDTVLQLRKLAQHPLDHTRRRELSRIAVAQQSDGILWRFALRRLASTEDNLERRFDLVFSKHLQALGDGRRLAFAKDLLISNNGSIAVQVVPAVDDGTQVAPEPYLEWKRGGPIDGRIIRLRFLEVAEETSSREVAEVAIMAVVEQELATEVDWTDQEKAAIKQRVAALLNNVQHPLGALSEEKREHFWSVVQSGLARSRQP